MTSNKNNKNGQEPRNSDLHSSEDSLSQDLEQLAREEAADVGRAQLMRAAEHEDAILEGFHAQLDAMAPAPKRFPRYVWPSLAAASLALFFALGDGFRSEDPATIGDGPALGVEQDVKITIESVEGTRTCFALQLNVPAEGFLELSFLDAAGSNFAGPIELNAQSYCYDSKKHGPLPERYRIEVSQWEQSMDGPEEFGDVYSQEFSSQD